MTHKIPQYCAILAPIMIIFIVIIPLLLATQEIMPDIYYFGDPNAPLVTILAGTHGNEPAPSIYLRDYIPQIVEVPKGYRFAIVPDVNVRAGKSGKRHMSSQPDINRAWPDKYSINKFLQPLIDDSSLIIDFHESWGFSGCQESLGQTLYTTDARLKPLLDNTVATLNNHASECMTWQRLDNVPVMPGTLDGYCKSRNIPYILVEMAGQNDVVSLDIRLQEMQIILYELLGLH